MSKLITQPNNFSCGPISLLNLLRWAGEEEKVSYRELYKLTECNKKNGTYFDGFVSALILVFEKTNLRLYPYDGMALRGVVPYSEVRKWLKNENGAIILLFHWEEGDQKDEHYVLMTEFKDEKVLVINPKQGVESSWVSRRELKKWLKPYTKTKKECESKNERDRYFPKAWFFQRDIGRHMAPA